MITRAIEYDIVQDREHYVVYIEGKFFCTADKLTEAVKEAETYLAERR